MNPFLLIFGGGFLAYMSYLAQQQAQTVYQQYQPTTDPTYLPPETPSWAYEAVQTISNLLWPSQMDISSQGLDFIRQQEGVRLNPYKDEAGVWTIGFGHKIVAGDPYYPFGSINSISPSQAEEIFERDVENIAASVVRGYVNVPLTQSQFDALTSLVYNIGQGNFGSSTLLVKLNNQDYTGASAEFTRWVYAGGKVSNILKNRRVAEANNFIGAA